MKYLIIQVGNLFKKKFNRNIPPKNQIFVDISELSHQDWGGGIQRTQKKIITHWLKHQKISKIIFVFSDESNLYEVKVSNKRNKLNFKKTSKRVNPQAGDIYLNIDLQYTSQYLKGNLLENLKRRKTKTVYLVFDILPILLPQYFPKNISELHLRWCKIAIQSDRIICISKKGMSDLVKFFKNETINNKIVHVYPGADFSNKLEYKFTKKNMEIDSTIRFIMVGTIEPRKNHINVLKVFKKLWDRNQKVQLTLIGKEGWNVKELTQEIRALEVDYPGKLNWFQSASDSELIGMLSKSDCLIQASIDEGFGIPIMEAAFIGLNLILNDIEIFREIAGEGAYFVDFVNSNSEEMIYQILKWIELFKKNSHPKSDLIKTSLWRDSSQEILEKVINVY